METPRNMFVSSLFKFTHLNNLKEIRHKNIASIKTLITVAHTDGDNLQVLPFSVARPLDVSPALIQSVGQTGIVERRVGVHF